LDGYARPQRKNEQRILGRQHPAAALSFVPGFLILAAIASLRQNLCSLGSIPSPAGKN
jgi:hypothetical protein